MSPIVLAALLLLVGLGLVVLEVFIPSGGILGFLSVVTLMSAIVVAFMQGPAAGFGLLAVAIVALPICLALAFRWWPHTPLGRRILLPVPTSEEVKPNAAFRRSLHEMVGKIGYAKSVMLPSGIVMIDSQAVDAVSEGMPIEAGQTVVVIQVRANHIVVRPVVDADLAEKSDQELSRPVDSLGLGPFDEPLA